MGHDLSKLEKRLEEHNRLFAELHNLALHKKLIPIIRQPWWTTEAEFALVENAIESQISRAGNLLQEANQLLAAAAKVAPKGAVAA